MTERQNLLFLSHRLPFPPHNGAAVRTYNILKLLSERYDITAICFDRVDNAIGFPIATRLAALAEFGRFEVFPIAQDGSRPRMLWDHLRSVARLRPYTYYVHDSRAFSAAVTQALSATRFDLVHVDSIDLVRHLDNLPMNKVVLTHHNAESVLLLRRAAAERNAIRRYYLAWQGRMIAEAEATWVAKAALNVVVSVDDQRHLQEVAPAAQFEVVPNGVDVRAFVPARGALDGLVFVGGMGYYPNLDALEWFASDVLPELRRLGYSGPVTVVGRATAAEQSAFGRHGITLTGYVPDIRPFVGAAACFIAPLRVGGGTRLKLLDAWAMGKAIVSTSIGAEGLEARDGDNILLADSANAFAIAVLRVLTDSALRDQLEAAGRQTAEKLYSWDVIGQRMMQRYEQIRIASKHPRGHD